jgi:RNA polymerase sigma-70 factor (sigma-E family)
LTFAQVRALCPGRDSNPYAFRPRGLSSLRLPFRHPGLAWTLQVHRAGRDNLIGASSRLKRLTEERRLRMTDDADFTEFVRANSRALLRTAFRLTGDRGLAEDLLQTALTTTYLRWSRIEHRAALPYTRRVLVNTATSWWRRMAWRSERPRGDVPDLVVEVITDALDDRATVIAAVRRLPPRQRAVIALRFLEDLSEAETARLLGCSPGTVKSQSHRALAKLRVLLDPATVPATALVEEDR